MQSLIIFLLSLSLTFAVYSEKTAATTTKGDSLSLSLSLTMISTGAYSS